MSEIVLTSDPNRFGLFHIGVEGTRIVETTGRRFYPEAYSNFKYGDGQVTDEYAALMALELMERFADSLSDTYLASSGFMMVPTAAFNLLSSVVAIMAANGRAPKGVVRIDRGVVKAVDYSTLTSAERSASNSGRRVTLPEMSRHQVAGSNLLIIDDTHVTGQTERETRRILNANADIADVTYAYLVLIEPAAAGNDSDPIEARLNHARVSRLADLTPIAASDDFRLNARTCKFILRAEPFEIREFAATLPNYRLMQIISAMVADGYHRMESHRDCFTALCSTAKTVLVRAAI